MSPTWWKDDNGVVHIKGDTPEAPVVLLPRGWTIKPTCSCVDHGTHMDVDRNCPVHGPRLRELHPEEED